MIVEGNRMEAFVIGGGVIGLSAAIRLQERGAQVTICSAAPPERTTSSVAAALWYPYRAYPEDRVLPWGREALHVFESLADDPRSGVALREGVELFRAPEPDPWWQAAVPELRRCRPSELRPPYRDGFVFTVPVIDMSVYLPYVAERFEAAGGAWEHRTLHTLDEATNAHALVVNCAGLGARELLPDPEMTPIRGQVVRVANPGLARFVLDEHHPDGVTYIIPRFHDCILGGTAVEDSWDLAPDPAVAEAILSRCVAIEPRLADAEIMEHKVGLRPGRPAIRLEREQHGSAIVIHCYGHGGAGVTLSWGCAAEVAALAGGD